MKEKLSKKIFLLGLIIFMISYLLPIEIFESNTSKTNWTHINVCLPNYWANRFNIWGKGK